MVLKRTADEAEMPTPRLRRETSKRAKRSPSAEARDNSSIPSSCSVSVDSALQSSPPASAHDRISSMSSLQSLHSDSDSGSSISSDSESVLSESDEEDDMVTIGGPKKPSIHRIGAADGHDDLKSRIAAFLPQLEEANSLLASEGGNYSMEDVEEGEQHIEMNLGLGVLEEQGGDESSSDSSSEQSDDEENVDDEAELPVSSGAVKRTPKDRETRHMEVLQGRDIGTKSAGIEEVE